jgi:hypothetical protein
MTCLATGFDCHTQYTCLGKLSRLDGQNGGMGVIFQRRCYSFDEHGVQGWDLCGLSEMCFYSSGYPQGLGIQILSAYLMINLIFFISQKKFEQYHRSYNNHSMP